jgi:L-iditol 2-dehydrogenase
VDIEMKALVYTGPNRLEYRSSEPPPEPRNDEVIVEVQAVGICGSDMHAYHGHDERRPPPLILGHEAAGIATSGTHKGKRVTINPLVTCGSCEVCLDGRSNLCRQRQLISMPPRPGAFAELVRIPEHLLVPVPDHLAIEQAALAEPIAVSYHAGRLGLRALPRPASSIRAAVLGGGAIGLASALVLHMEGVGEIFVAETNAHRRATVERSGPFTAYAPATAQEPKDSSVDLVIDAVGAEQTRAAACRLVKPGGVFVHIGLLPGSGGVDIRKITLQEITLIGTYCYTMPDFRETVAAMAAGRLGALDWHEVRPLSDGIAAVADIDAGRTATAKIVLRPGV